MDQEQAKQKLAESATAILDSIKDGIDWGAGQAPIVAQEYLKLYIFGAWLDLVLGVFFTLLFLVTAIFSYKRFMKEYKNKDENGRFNSYNVGAYISSVSCVIISIVIFTATVPKSVGFLYKGYNAPRIVVLEGIKGLF